MKVGEAMSQVAKWADNAQVANQQLKNNEYVVALFGFLACWGSNTKTARTAFSKSSVMPGNPISEIRLVRSKESDGAIDDNDLPPLNWQLKVKFRRGSFRIDLMSLRFCEEVVARGLFGLPTWKGFKGNRQIFGRICGEVLRMIKDNRHAEKQQKKLRMSQDSKRQNEVVVLI